MANEVVTVHIQGLDELEAKLYDLPTKFARRAMREAIGPAIDIWKEEIRARVEQIFTKYETGWMASHVDTKITTKARDEAGEGMVGFSTATNPSRHQEHPPSAANEAYWGELGTSRQPARPFMRAAFESKASAVLDAFTSKLKELLDDTFK